MEIVDESKTPLTQLWCRWCGSGGALISSAAHYIPIMCVTPPTTELMIFILFFFILWFVCTKTSDFSSLL